MLVWTYTLVSVIIVSLLSLIGIFTLTLNNERLKKILLFLVSFAVGGLFGDALIHLLPETFRVLGTKLVTSLYILFGILIFFILERFIRWRHCHVLDEKQHVHPVVTMNIIGDSAHNLIDGMIIGASYSISIPIGITTSLAVILHEIPHEIGNFAILVHGGLSVKRALLYNFLTALTAILGAILSLLIGTHVKNYSLIIMPITAGGFLYIAGSDLIPELHHNVEIKESLVQLICILLGIGIMALLIVLG